MGDLSKGLASVLILLIAFSCLSLLIAKPAKAQSVTTPSVPQFTISYSPVSGGGILLTITNQQFTPPNGLSNLGYAVRVKLHSDQYWFYLNTVTKNNPDIRLQDGGNTTSIGYSHDGFIVFGQVDFEVEAVTYTLQVPLNPDSGFYAYKTSGWSNSTTINIPADNRNWNPEVTPSSPSVPEFPALAILPLLLSVLSVAVIVRHRKNRQTSEVFLRHRFVQS